MIKILFILFASIVFPINSVDIVNELFDADLKWEFYDDVKDDFPFGEMTWIFESGKKYVGEIKESEFEGLGTLTHKDGKIEKGVWKKNKLVK